MKKLLYAVLGGLIAGLAIAVPPNLSSPGVLIWMFLIGTGVFAVIEVLSKLVDKSKATHLLKARRDAKAARVS